MKQFLITFLMLVFSIQIFAQNTQSMYKFNTHTKASSCEVVWMVYQGKKIRPTNPELKTSHVEIADNGDSLIYKTKNYTSSFKYNSFIDTKNYGLGVDFIKNGRFLDIFNNGDLYIGNVKTGVDAKYHCKDIRLNIQRAQ